MRFDNGLNLHTVLKFWLKSSLREVGRARFFIGKPIKFICYYYTYKPYVTMVELMVRYNLLLVQRIVQMKSAELTGYGPVW